MFTLKRQSKQSPAHGGSSRSTPTSESGGKKVAPGEIRIQKDIGDLDLDSSTVIQFPNKDNLLEFHITIRPKEGYYKGGSFQFNFTIPSMYPHEPPKVKCTTKVYHPNIDLQGNVCLNILREDWKPILNLNSIIYGLQFLLLMTESRLKEPNAEDPLNKEAAQCMRENTRLFEQNVNRSMRGGVVGGHYFDRCLGK